MNERPEAPYDPYRNPVLREGNGTVLTRNIRNPFHQGVKYL